MTGPTAKLGRDLRCGDVNRFTHFSITHSYKGQEMTKVEEIVNLVLLMR